MHIMICDDNKEFLSAIRSSLEQNLAGRECEITVCEKGRSALKLCAERIPDISFLDIDMPDVSGFNIAKEIYERKKDAIIIFVTGHENYVFTSLRYRPLRFIRKAYLESELPEALNAAINEILCQNKFLDLGSRYENEKIGIGDILYFESKGNYAEVTHCNGNKYRYRSTLSKLEKELELFDFLRVHAGFLVNMKHIQKIYKNTLFLPDGIRINISRRLYPRVQASYAAYLRK